MRGRWLLPFVFGGLMAGMLFQVDAARSTQFDATAQVHLPRVYLGAGEAESRLSAPLAEEAAMFDSDRITEAIVAEYTGDLDPASAATAVPATGTDSILVVEVGGTSESDVRELADVAATVFARVRHAEQLESVRAQINGLTTQSRALQKEIEDLVMIDLATRQPEPEPLFPTDEPAPLFPVEETPIQVVIAPLATQRADTDARISAFEQAESVIELDGPSVSRLAEVTSTKQPLGRGLLIGLIGAATLAGVALAAALGRRLQGTSVTAADDEHEADPSAWIELLSAEADGVFIDLTRDFPEWDMPGADETNTEETVAGSTSTGQRARVLSALHAAESFLAATNDERRD